MSTNPEFGKAIWIVATIERTTGEVEVFEEHFGDPEEALDAVVEYLREAGEIVDDYDFKLIQVVIEPASPEAWARRVHARIEALLDEEQTEKDYAPSPGEFRDYRANIKDILDDAKR